MLDGMRLRNFSIHGQKAYLLAVQAFAKYFGRTPEKISLKNLGVDSLSLNPQHALVR